eukprot:CAMPEP_0119530892 /NCGR_PEP_ID=MMETSP1344-20130328/44673_1 /TAXON_ID=236787 /ORGANISM="Florenciella parvula, Strain CCMP2471" /LENGTH=202 /DNA_ID=CAMNT_0007570993 /DNA_START=375 /DNA_END=985 /DNA_ORIENTATION=-
MTGPVFELVWIVAEQWATPKLLMDRLPVHHRSVRCSVRIRRCVIARARARARAQGPSPSRSRSAACAHKAKVSIQATFDPALEPASEPASSARRQSWDAKRWSLCDVAARAPYEDNFWEGRELITAFGGDRLDAGFTNRPSGVVSKPRCEILRDVVAASLQAASPFLSASVLPDSASDASFHDQPRPRPQHRHHQDFDLDLD